MGMAFWSFAGSKVINLNLYWRTTVRRGHITAPSSSPNFVQAFHQGGYLCSSYSRTIDEPICCYSNRIKDGPACWSLFTPLTWFLCISCCRICIYFLKKAWKSDLLSHRHKAFRRIFSQAVWLCCWLLTGHQHTKWNINRPMIKVC